jgi:multidrug efflux pump subunit AcrB
MRDSGQELLVQGRGRVRRIDEIADTVVTVRGDVPIRVRDLGSVQLGPALQRGEGSAMGDTAVVISLTKQPYVNTLKRTERLEETLDEIATSLPVGMVIQRDIFRRADFVSTSIHNIQTELRNGGILVVLIVLLFLGNVRANAITLTSIPLSLLTTVLVLWAWGESINTRTLGGMAIAIGALVDDAIVGVKNVFRRLRDNAKLPSDARNNVFAVIYRAIVEIRSSIVFATVIVVLVFLRLFFLPGIEDRLQVPLGVAMTLTPALCYYMLPSSRCRVGRGAQRGRPTERVEGTSGRYLTNRRVLPWPGQVSMVWLGCSLPRGYRIDTGVMSPTHPSAASASFASPGPALSGSACPNCSMYWAAALRSASGRCAKDGMGVNWVRFRPGDFAHATMPSRLPA